jgi:hypothetical protein
VTGLVSAFGLHLGFSRTDVKRLALAGIMHDIGKARVPVSILEKPGPLDADEMKIIKRHPLFGWRRSATRPTYPRKSSMPSGITTNIWTGPGIRTAWPERRSRILPD